MSSIPGSGRSPGRGHGNPLQYSCLENSMDRGAWWASVHGVTNSQTRLKQLNMYSCSRCSQNCLHHCWSCYLILWGPEWNQKAMKEEILSSWARRSISSFSWTLGLLVLGPWTWSELQPWLSWVSSLLMEDQGTSWPPSPCEPIPVIKSPHKYLYEYFYMSQLLCFSGQSCLMHPGILPGVLGSVYHRILSAISWQGSFCYYFILQRGKQRLEVVKWLKAIIWM